MNLQHAVFVESSSKVPSWLRLGGGSGAKNGNDDDVTAHTSAGGYYVTPCGAAPSVDPTANCYVQQRSTPAPAWSAACPTAAAVGGTPGQTTVVQRQVRQETVGGRTTTVVTETVRTGDRTQTVTKETVESRGTIPFNNETFGAAKVSLHLLQNSLFRCHLTRLKNRPTIIIYIYIYIYM